MDKLKIDFENCFGIGKLEHEFDFSISNIFLLYAPNGTMKSSFAKSLHLISKNDPNDLPRDRVYPARLSKHDVLTDGNAINPDKILVINSEDNSFDASSKISTFLASKELKEKYDEIYLDLNASKANFIKKLKTISSSTDCESEFVNSFSENTTSFFEILLSQIGVLKEKFEKLDFRYNDIFDKKGNVKNFLEKNQNILDEYVNNYKNLIAKSKFFRDSDKNSFGTYQAKQILKSIEDNSFFDAGHKIVLEDGTEIADSNQLKEIVLQEIQNIINDEKLQKAFQKIDDAIAANAELRAFKKVIDKDNLILINLKNYDSYKKDVWITYLSEIKEDALHLASHYGDKKIELQTIIDEAKKESALWIKIISTFNSRFHVPFKVLLENQDDIVLKQQTANLAFDYSDNNGVPVRQNRDVLLNILSKGEQRAYFILQFLFEIESRKNSPEKHLLVFDDVADSFDYKNKFAIIEYIRELEQADDFRIIVLTHNFDFYRTLASRVQLHWNASFIATKSDNKEIKLHSGKFRKDVFPRLITQYSDQKAFISLITFVRNLIEFSEPKNSPEYLLLTSCLHKKIGSDDLTANEVFGVYKTRVAALADKSILFGDEKIISFILNTAESICNEANIDEILLENKITLAIAIRLQAEHYLINKLPTVDLNTITSNQTQKLYKKYSAEFPASNALAILDRVNMMTPENIHLNAFMYEPLIDMSVHHLIQLFKDTQNLN